MDSVAKLREGKVRIYFVKLNSAFPKAKVSLQIFLLFLRPCYALMPLKYRLGHVEPFRLFISQVNVLEVLLQL